METRQKLKEGLAPENGMLIPAGQAQITTVDMFDQSRAKGALLVADMISSSSLIPEHYQRRPDNVFVAMYRSARLGMDLFAYMETTYPVNGRLGHEAKFITSLINTSGKFKTPLLYEMSGEIIRNPDGTLSPKSTRKCKAWAIIKEVNEKISQEVDIEMAIREGWATKNGPDKTLKSNKWQTMPDVMLQYRAAKFFGNMYCPELVMGLNTKDELEDISDGEVIEETEVWKDIFEKGNEVDVTPAPVLDPALNVNTAPETVKSQELPQSAGNTLSGPVVDMVPQSIIEKPGTPAAHAETGCVETKYLPLTPAEACGEPPIDPASFKMWLLRRFCAELHDLDVFLLSKKWLSMGETASDLNESKIKNLREQWKKFLAAYDVFKKSRTADKA